LYTKWLKRYLFPQYNPVRKFARIPSRKSNMLPTGYPYKQLYK
jgi:hypothetical protein